MTTNPLTRLAIILAAFLAGCGGGGGSAGGSSGTPSVGPPIPIVKTYTFPAGSATASPGNTAWDIVGVKTTLSQQFGGGGGNLYDTLRVDVTFTQDITNALPAPGQPLSLGTQLGVEIGLDVDGNPNTGNFRGCNLQSTATPFEYFSDAGNDPVRLADGNYSIIGAGGAPIASGGYNPPSEADTAVAGKVLTQTFFLQSINVNAGDGPPRIRIAVSAFNGVDSSPTDCVPHGTLVEL